MRLVRSVQSCGPLTPPPSHTHSLCQFYWNPTREDRVGVCVGIFQHDNVDREDIEKLVDAFPGQSIDFFGALRARVYDDKVRRFPHARADWLCGLCARSC